MRNYGPDDGISQCRARINCSPMRCRWKEAYCGTLEPNQIPTGETRYEAAQDAGSPYNLIQVQCGGDGAVERVKST
jgi:hypothetical protein